MIASLANILAHGRRHAPARRRARQGPLGVIVGNFTGTLIVYLGAARLPPRAARAQFDAALLREMNHFGLPLVPSALFLWVTNFSDRFFLVKLDGRRPRSASTRSASASRRRWCSC